METAPQEVEKRCCVCGTEKYVHKHRSTGNLYCTSCLALDDSRKDICTDCGENKPVYNRLTDNKPQCKSCYSKTYIYPKETCMNCKQLKRVAKRLDGGKPQCITCYNEKYQREYRKRRKKEEKTQ